MAYIYKISNIVNDKVYIGKTQFSIEKRWSEHLKDSNKKYLESRPLYRAMHKHGKDKFRIEVLEECSCTSACEREQYWIRYYNSFKNGYNATTGGDGKPYVDYNAIDMLWADGLAVYEISRKVKCSSDTVRAYLKNKGISHSEIVQRACRQQQRKVAMYSLDDKLLREFDSIRAATDYCISIGKANIKIKENATSLINGGHIPSVCKGLRKTAYGFKWKYVN